MNPGFPFGSSYSPLIFPESEWEKDLSKMHSAGMNLVRIGDVHGSWDRIEPRSGEMQLDILRRFYQAADRFDINILLCTGTSSPPLWLALIYPDALILSNRGEHYPLGASYNWACIHHPGYLQATENYLNQLVLFAVSQNNHFGWQISNEIGFPFLPTREQNTLGLYCYCDHCQKEFRVWLQKKYKTVEDLTEAWSWSTTNFVYNEWEDICAPESLPESWSGVTRWLDWRLFWQYAFTQFIKWQHDLIRKIDKNHPTSTNTFNFKSFDRFGTIIGMDQWQIAEKIDHIGYDLYPGSGDKLHFRPEHNSIFLDHGRSVALTTGRNFWTHEIESGPIGGWVFGPDHDTDEKDILNYVVEALGHDVKLALFMPWREVDYQPLHWGALVDMDGNPGQRLKAAQSIGNFIQDQSDFFINSHVSSSEIALLETKPNAIFFRGVNQEEILFSAQRDSYRSFWEQGYSVDFITQRQLSLDYLQKYRIICLPMIGLIDESHARHLESFVVQGGILIGFARCGTLNEKGWFHHQIPVRGLKEVFGIHSAHAGTLQNDHIQFNGLTYDGYLNRDCLIVDPETEIIAHFTDGLPAVTINQKGKGLGVYIATQVDGGNLCPQDDLLSAVIREIAKRNNIYPQKGFTTNIQRSGGIDPHTLEFGNRTLILFSNYYSKDISTHFWMSAKNRCPAYVCQLFPNKLKLLCEQQDDFIKIPLSFKSREVMVIEIAWN